MLCPKSHNLSTHPPYFLSLRLFLPIFRLGGFAPIKLPLKENLKIIQVNKKTPPQAFQENLKNFSKSIKNKFLIHFLDKAI